MNDFKALEIGKFDNLKAKLLSISRTNTEHGILYRYKFISEHNQKLLWSTHKDFGELGTIYVLKGTCKESKEFKGVIYNIITRITVTEF